jgi:hypothetical protein
VRSFADVAEHIAGTSEDSRPWSFPIIVFVLARDGRDGLAIRHSGPPNLDRSMARAGDAEFHTRKSPLELDPEIGCDRFMPKFPALFFEV